jgi:hypothetical protein
MGPGLSWWGRWDLNPDRSGDITRKSPFFFRKFAFNTIIGEELALAWHHG